MSEEEKDFWVEILKIKNIKYNNLNLESKINSIINIYTIDNTIDKLVSEIPDISIPLNVCKKYFHKTPLIEI